MRGCSVSFRQSAREDLNEIYRYIREQGGLGQTAKTYIGRIRNRCQKIGDIPLGGVARPDLGPDIRMAVFERSVVILYTAIDDTVWITNIISGGRDYETLFDRRGNVPPEDPA